MSADSMRRSEMNKQAALVTGAGSGIGRAIAHRLSADGRAVAVLDRSANTAAEVADEIQDHGGRALGIAADVAIAGDVASAFSLASETFSGIDVVVANAGVWAPGTVGELTDEEWSLALAVNLTGVFLTARSAVRAFAGHDAASFIAVASDVGVQGSQGCAAYVACKHAVVGLVRSMALDYGPQGVRSNVICPGFIDTPMAAAVFASGDEARKRAREAEVPSGRFGRPEEVANLTAFLVDGGTYMNGSVVLSDGGATAGYFHGTPDGRST